MIGSQPEHPAPADQAACVPAAADARGRDLSTLARGGALNVGGILVNAVTALAFTVIIARALGASRSGTFFVALAVFTVLESVSLFGAETGAMRMIARYQALGRVRDTRALFRAGLVPVIAFGTVLGAALFAVAPDVARVITDEHRDEMATYLRILAPAVPFAGGLSVALAASRGFGNMLPYVVIGRIGRPVLRIVLVVAAILVGTGADGLMVAAVAPVVVAYATALAWLRVIVVRAVRRAPADAAPSASMPAIVREFWGFTIVRGFAALVGAAVMRIDVILLAALATSRDAGIYAAASRVVAAGTFAQGAVRIVIGPQITEMLAREEVERAREVYRVSSVWVTVVAFPLYVAIAASAPLVLGIFGEDFRAGAPALVIMTLAMLFNMATGAVTTILVVAGRTSWNLANTLVTAAVNVGLNVALIPAYGMLGAAIALASSTVVQNSLPLFQIWKDLDMHPFSRSMALAVIGALCCFGVLGVLTYAALGHTYLALAVFLVLASIAYLAFLVRMRSELLLDEFWARLRGRPPRRSHAA